MFFYNYIFNFHKPY